MIANSVSSQPQCSGQPLSFDGNQTTFTVVEILNGECNNIEGLCQGLTKIEKQDETAIPDCATYGKSCDVSSVQEATDKPKTPGEKTEEKKEKISCRNILCIENHEINMHAVYKVNLSYLCIWHKFGPYPVILNMEIQSVK